MPHLMLLGLWIGVLLLLTGQIRAATFMVATYNLNNYVDDPGGARPVKTEASRAKIRESIRALSPDVLALQEMGTEANLQELRTSLRREGLDYPHWQHARGWDTNINVAILSRFPLRSSRSHTNENFLLRGRRFHASRAFAEVEVQVHANYRFTLLTAHLKSRRAVPEADESELREQEALLLRRIIDARLAADPRLNLVVLGDFNDLKNSPALKTILGKGTTALVDTRPAERNGDNLPAPVPNWSPARITWTHFYAKEDTYSRVDYILLSRGMAREWVREGTYVLALPNWGLASDHRPLIAQFTASDR